MYWLQLSTKMIATVHLYFSVAIASVLLSEAQYVPVLKVLEAAEKKAAETIEDEHPLMLQLASLQVRDGSRM